MAKYNNNVWPQNEAPVNRSLSLSVPVTLLSLLTLSDNLIRWNWFQQLSMEAKR